MKYISILGSTGSIGIQALQVISDLNSDFKVVGLSAKSNIDLIERQIEQFKPEIVVLEDESSANALRNRVKNQIEIISGQDGIIKIATFPKTDIVLSSIVGIAGLIPTLEAIKAGKDIALANKEVLVTSGSLVMKTARQAGVNILPVDGEHSAIFQCLSGCKNHNSIHRLILTASGGPFRDKTRDELKKVSPEQALYHPTWKMGKKITIDSATLMNKGLEVIEARWLFDVDVSKIDVIIHPQSIVHSLVEFTDGSILAQLGITDMRLPIQFALTYPQRTQSILPRLDLLKVGKLTFQDVDMEKFPCLKYAYEAIRLGGTMPTVLSGADEVAVEAFLKGKIGFLDISGIIGNTMNVYKENGFSSSEPSLDDIISADRWARNHATNTINEHNY